MSTLKNIWNCGLVPKLPHRLTMFNPMFYVLRINSYDLFSIIDLLVQNMISVVVKKLTLNPLTDQTHQWLCYRHGNETSIYINLLKHSIGTKPREKHKISLNCVNNFSPCLQYAAEKSTINLTPIWYSDSLWRMDKNLAQYLQHFLLVLIYHIFLLNYCIRLLACKAEGHVYITHYRIV